MDAVRDLLTERAVLGLIATLAVLGLFVALCRARRVSTSVEDAVMDMLHRMSKASADLREGLTEDAANKATPHLREMLRCVAVGITDHEGTLLSWDGGANDHYEFLRAYIDAPSARATRSTSSTASWTASCPARARCTAP